MKSCIVTAWLNRLLVFAMLLATGAALAQPIEIEVAGPYVELRTGPGRGYPAFRAVERGAALVLLKRRNDWFQVRTTDREFSGWTHREDLRASLEASGLGDLADPRPDQARFTLGMAVGRFEEDPVVEIAGGYRINADWLAKATVAQVVGTYSNTWMFGVGAQRRFDTDSRFVPTLGLGLLWLENSPRRTLLGEDEHEGWGVRLGAGLGYRLRQGLELRAELEALRAQFDDQEETFLSATAGFAFWF